MEQHEAARVEGTELREAGDDTWDDPQSGIEQAWNTMERAMKAVTSRFR